MVTKEEFMKWIRRLIGTIIGRRIEARRIFPVATKMVLIYVLFILLSNFSSHYISLNLYRGELIKLMRQLLVRDLKEIYTFANTQYEISGISGSRDAARRQIEAKAVLDFKHARSLLIGVNRDGLIGMQASRSREVHTFSDMKVLRGMTGNLEKNKSEGFISFSYGGKKYFGVYKYNPNWEMFLIRAEEFNEFNENSRRVFGKISLIILIITIGCAVVGVFIINYVLRFIRTITNDIIQMTRKNEIKIIDLKGGADR